MGMQLTCHIEDDIACRALQADVSGSECTELQCDESVGYSGNASPLFCTATHLNIAEFAPGKDPSRPLGNDLERWCVDCWHRDIPSPDRQHVQVALGGKTRPDHEATGPTLGDAKDLIPGYSDKHLDRLPSREALLGLDVENARVDTELERVQNGLVRTDGI